MADVENPVDDNDRSVGSSGRQGTGDAASIKERPSLGNGQGQKLNGKDRRGDWINGRNQQVEEEEDEDDDDDDVDDDEGDQNSHKSTEDADNRVKSVTNGSHHDDDLEGDVDAVIEDDDDAAQEVCEEEEEEDMEDEDTDTAAGNRTSPRKQPRMDLAEMSDSFEEDEDEVEEVRDDEDMSSDSIMEVDAEDAAGGDGESSDGRRSLLTHSKAQVKATNIVTVDDLKTLQSLANSAKKKEAAGRTAAESDKSGNVVLIDTNTILAGRATSGVTITPAKSRILPGTSTTIGSGVTISHASGRPVSRGVGLPLGTTMTSLSSSSTSSPSSSSFSYDKLGNMNDPNLTDDTFVVEAPSFIVPYVYEKPPKETFKAFRDSVAKLMEEKKKADDKTSKKKEDDKENKEEEEDSDEDQAEEDEEQEGGARGKAKPDPETVTTNNSSSNVGAKKSDNYFESSLGKFISDIGLSLVQEFVQGDLLKEQTKKSQKDKSASVMHAIMSLKKNLEVSKQKNESFHFELKKCRFCSFRTESNLIMENHMETPHMKNGFLRCNFCSYDTKIANDIILHMHTSHGITGRLERAIAVHQCSQCPYEDNMRGKLTRHKVGCDKRFRPDRNQEPPHDWEPPAKIPKPTSFRGSRPPMHGMAGNSNYHTLQGGPGIGAQFGGAAAMAAANRNHLISQRSAYSSMPQLQYGPSRGRGRPIGTYKPGQPLLPGYRQGLGHRPIASTGQASYLNNQVVLQTVHNQPGRIQGSSSAAALLNNLGANSSVTIQSISQRNNHPRSGHPSISITPLPGRSSNLSSSARSVQGAGSAHQTSLKPGQPTGQGKSGFVICEICDGYIKDLEQLRNHMQWIHKVKIHPKMIYNRPPLNCQKCQFRFFTDQGLERHLLGSHGLVTASMQDLANKGQDSGRCPVCGKVYQWKLLTHVASDHQKTLKPAHLSYKCTVCTATFGQYKLFENHVYTAHSGSNKRAGNAARQSTHTAQAGTAAKASTNIKVSNEITIIPQGSSLSNSKSGSSSSIPKRSESQQSSRAEAESYPDVIDVDDDDEEIDDVEESDEGRFVKKRGPSDGDIDKNKNTARTAEPEPKKSKAGGASHITEDTGDDEEGVEEIHDDDEDD